MYFFFFCHQAATGGSRRLERTMLPKKSLIQGKCCTPSEYPRQSGAWRRIGAKGERTCWELKVLLEEGAGRFVQRGRAEWFTTSQNHAVFLIRCDQLFYPDVRGM